jgi:hypothetical protein
MNPSLSGRVARETRCHSHGDKKGRCAPQVTRVEGLVLFVKLTESVFAHLEPKKLVLCNEDPVVRGLFGDDAEISCRQMPRQGLAPRVPATPPLSLSQPLHPSREAIVTTSASSSRDPFLPLTREDVPSQLPLRAACRLQRPRAPMPRRDCTAAPAHVAATEKSGGTRDRSGIQRRFHCNP